MNLFFIDETKISPHIFLFMRPVQEELVISRINISGFLFVLLSLGTSDNLVCYIYSSSQFFKLATMLQLLSFFFPQLNY